MTFFELQDPFRSQFLWSQYGRALAMQDLGGLLKVHWRKRMTAVACCMTFTEIDQAFVLWGLATLVIFSLAQFSHMSWNHQAIVDAAITGAAIANTSGLTWPIAIIAKLRWVVCLWAVLMAIGVVLTAHGIFSGVGWILLNLCPLWLGLCAVGYAAMAVGMRSRCFAAAAIVHAFAALGIDHLSLYQFAGSGLVIALTLFFFSVVPWDMQAEEEAS